MRKYHNNLGILSGLAVVIMAVSLFGILGTSSIGKENDGIIIETVDDSSKNNASVDNAEPNADEVDEVVKEDVPETINGLLIGFDKSGSLTDVLMVGHINPQEDMVKIISVPRDLEIYFYDDDFIDIKKNNPKNGVAHCKINEIYTYLGKDQQALEDLKTVVGRICNLDIDYVMTIDISGVKNVVDSVGGVEFDVARDMYYTDPADGLVIDLKKGLQMIDGDKAEQLLRYRKGYTRGDLERIEVQQKFVSEFIHTVLELRDFDQITDLMKNAYDMVDTDFGLVVMLEYAQFFYNHDLDNILSKDNMITIPSYGELVEEHWFQYFEIDKAHQAVEDLLSGEVQTTTNQSNE